MVYEIKNFAINQLTHEIFEMMLVQPLMYTNVLNPLGLVYYTNLALIKAYSANNPHASAVNPGQYAQRLFRDDLPGYFLGLHSDGGDDTAKFLQRYLGKASTQSTQSVHVELYIANPGSLEENKIHSIEVLSKPHQAYGSEDQATLKELRYTIEVEMQFSSIQFRYKREGTLVPASVINFPDTGTGNFIYFSFTVGGGIVFFASATDMRARFYETFIVYEQGSSPETRHATYDLSTAISTLFAYESNMIKERWAKIEYTPPAGKTLNEPGFRVVVLTMGVGVYPPQGISSMDVTASYPRCYFSGYKTNTCYAMGSLKDASETSYSKYRTGKTGLKTESSNTDMSKLCRVFASETRCLSPLPDIIINLEDSLRSPVPHEAMKITDYDGLEQRFKDFFHEFTSNTGKRYLVSCPSSCKC